MNATNCTSELISLAMTTGTPEYLKRQAFLIALTILALPLNWLEGYLESRTEIREHVKFIQKTQRWTIYIFCFGFLKNHGAHFFRHLVHHGCDLLVESESCGIGNFFMNFANKYLHFSMLAIVLTFYPNNFIMSWRNYKYNVALTTGYPLLFSIGLVCNHMATSETLIASCMDYESEISRMRDLKFNLGCNILSFAVFIALFIWHMIKMENPVLHLQISEHHFHTSMKKQMDLFLPNLMLFGYCFIPAQFQMLYATDDFLYRLNALLMVPLYFVISPIVNIMKYFYQNRHLGFHRLIIEILTPVRRVP